jgi:PAS domain S-box-containing protein
MRSESNETAPVSPAPVFAPMDDEGQTAQVELSDAAAKAAIALCAAVGAMQLLAGLVGQTLLGVSSELNMARFVSGGLFLALAGIGLLAHRRNKFMQASLWLMLGAGVAVVAHGVLSGLGLHSSFLPGFALLVAMAGTLLGPGRSAVGLGIFLVMIASLAWADLQGLVDGQTAAKSLSMAGKVTGLVMLGIGAMVAAVALRRMIQRSAHRAHTEKQRLATWLRVGSDWTWEADSRGLLRYASSAFETHTGTPVQDFLRMDQPQGPRLLTDSDRERMKEALRSRQPFRDLQVAFRRLDGEEIHMRLNGEPVIDPQGRTLGWWGLGRNVTEEVLRERRAQSVRDMLDRLFRMAPDATCLVRMDTGQVLFANPAYLVFCGRSESEVLGRTGRDIGLWARKGDDVEMARALAKGHGVIRDWRFEAVRADGERLTALVTGATFEWNGLPVAVLSVRDVTAAERARMQADAILDSASVGIALVSRRRFVRVNPALAVMCQRDAKELIGQPITVIFAGLPHFNRDAPGREAAMARGETVQFEVKLPGAGGGVVVLRMQGRAIDVNRFEEAGQLWLVEDISQARRTARELADARRQAESASRAKSAFLATMSHEIRTPLNGVVGLARLLDTETHPVRRAQYTKHLLESAQALSGLVSDVLDLSKIEAGRMALEQAPFDLHDVVTNAFQAFAALGEERRLSLSCVIDPAVARSRVGDAVRVRQIVANYLGNALKFTEQGQISLRVSAPTDRRVRIEVRDTGIGIAEAAQATLFQPFAQADSSTTRRFGGSGLGLSICSELAHLMGGEVGVSSQPGSGSLFWAELELPLNADASLPQSPAEAQPLAGLRVLVAEDNEVNRLIAQVMLERLGATVSLAADGSEAVDMALTAQPAFDAVLMDLHMPVQDGLSAARALRANPMTAHLTLIAWTAAVLGQERADARAAGMDEFVGKPVFEADLLRVLQPLAKPG